MASQIDYLTNIPLQDDEQRIRETLRLQNAFGYVPVFAPSMPDMTTGKKLLAHIIQEYPGYRWVIEIRDTIITVMNETLDSNWGFRLREKMLDNDGHVIKRFCGELLERYRLKRGAIDVNAVAALPGIGRGNKKRIGE